MERKGINYDTGIVSIGERLSRQSFDPTQVRREIEIIARDLHCTAIRISGRDPQRIALAAGYALEEGLEVWFSPFPTNMTDDELVPYFATAAQMAEQLRGRPGQAAGQPPPQVVFVLGCEMSLFNSGFVPGSNMFERFQAMMNPALLASQSLTPEKLEEQFNDFLGQAVSAVRDNFAGQVTYASGTWERVDWSLFDLVGVDLYRDASNQDRYREQVRSYAANGKPVVITEFGCCTYKGAQDRGALGWAIVDRTTNPPRLTEEVVRDEQVQVDYLTDVLSILTDEEVDGAFWFTFAGYEYPYNPDPRYDLDCASYGVVRILDGTIGKTYPGLPWEPKRSFYALAERYG